MTLGRYAQALLRIGSGLLFFEHGVQKMFGVIGGFGAPGVTAPLVSMYGAAGLLEMFGGLLLVVGFATRPVAAVLMVEMIAAYTIAHAPRGGWPVQNQGELPLLYALVFANIAGHGAGAFSVDGLLRAPIWKLERRHFNRDRRQPLPISL